MAKTKKNTVLTIGELIARKEQKSTDKKKLYELEIENEGIIQCKTLDRKTILDSFDFEDGDGDLYLIYESCVNPNLKENELQEAYKITGFKIVEELFPAGTITKIAEKILQKHGYFKDSVRFVKDIKN